MKQTAVDWLFFMLNNPNRNQEFANKLLEKAKELEKENLKDFYFGGINFELYPTTKGFEEYYSETFKSE